MIDPLSAEEARVLGALLEKERTTPQQYPLTLNALRSACNQTTNRDPVVDYGDDLIQRVVDGLKAKGLLRFVYSPSNRGTKYRQILDEVLSLDPPGAALVAILLLRGPQTPGELKTRSERLHPFGGLDAVVVALDALADRDDPLVVRLERQPGQKEARYVELLSEPATIPVPTSRDEGADHRTAFADPGAAEATGATDTGAIAVPDRLEVEVARLRREVDELRLQFDEFRRQFD